MNNRPTAVRVFGSSLVADPYAPAFRPYLYGGDRPLKKEPAKTRPDAPECSVEDCGHQAHARGYCNSHYYQLHRKAKAASAATPTASEPLTKE